MKGDEIIGWFGPREILAVPLCKIIEGRPNSNSSVMR